jgi:site-specific DNA-methyltransferase (adenine-specific)/adenine-specific DNA-methyltransferase
MITPEQRQEIIRLLEKGEELSPEWARILFPPEKREYELVYHGKEREEDIIANTLAVPLQPVRTFGTNGSKVNGDWHNMLIFGDNLQIMKSLLEMKKDGKLCNADGTPGVRLVCIDPPFATKQDFRGSQDQKAYQDKIAGAKFLEFLRKRLIFLRELLSEDGSIYVHLDQRKGHYVKTIMDEIFREEKLINEIVWCYTGPSQTSNYFPKKHEIIFWYAKGGTWIFNAEKLRVPYKKSNIATGGTSVIGRGTDERLKELDERGKLVEDWWNDIATIGYSHNEIINYPTQKPEALLFRIINASSNPGDLVLDVFGGSGTTLAVADKLGRRWIGLDCGKLAIYTMQKRLLNIAESKDLENPKKKYGKQCKPFTLYNAGLYDFSKLKELSWDSWRFFALQLFQCRDEPHTVGGIKLDGYLKGSSVLVFNHMKEKGVRIDEDTIESLHEALGTRIGNRLFIIAPALTFDFQQDYITLDGVRYYALRIPYSIINELHHREFTCLKQPSDEMAVNDTVEAVGFDFIRTPELKFECGTKKGKGDSQDTAYIKIKTFKSEAVVREPMQKKGNLETLSMVMLDYDFDEESQVFDLDAVFYADALEKASWTLNFPVDAIGKKAMVVFIDIYGNEARVVVEPEQFGVSSVKKKKRSR